MSMDIPHWYDEAVAGREFEGFQQLQKGRRDFAAG
jgi:hypothetical protein